MKFKKMSKKVLFLTMALVVALSSGTNPASAVTRTITVEFPESLEQKRTQTITIPGLREVKSVTVDNGRVSYSVNGDNVTITVENGSPSRTYTPSKTVTVKRGPQDSTSFPSSITYNDGTYSGTLYKSGSYYPDGKRIDTKTVEITYGRQSSTNFPETYYYNSDGYTGILSKYGAPYQDGYQYSYKYVQRTLGPQETTDFPSSIYVAEGGYSGSINKSGSYYVSGTVSKQLSKDYSPGYVIVGETCLNPLYGGSCTDNILHDWCYEQVRPIVNSIYWRDPLRKINTCSSLANRVVNTPPSGVPYVYTDREGYSGIVKWIGQSCMERRQFYWQTSNVEFVRVTCDKTLRGTLYKNVNVNLYSQDYAGYISKPEYPLYNQKYRGEVSKEIQQYSQNYSGTVYGPTQRYYSYIVTLEVEAIDTTITAGVYHTDAWAEKRGIDRDDPNFLAGEAFLVEVETSRDATDVDLKVAPSIPIDVKWDKEYDGDIVRWKTVLYDPAYKDMKGSYTFSIEVSYPLDLTSKEQVTIYVSGNVHGLSNIHLTQ